MAKAFLMLLDILLRLLKELKKTIKGSRIEREREKMNGLNLKRNKYLSWSSVFLWKICKLWYFYRILKDLIIAV